ncbi:MAG: hypothetical protein HY721_15465 [Planctomycetes bacterium]|nr:hypothetical protein [Planctomycetota bacterium]
MERSLRVGVSAAVLGLAASLVSAGGDSPASRATKENLDLPFDAIAEREAAEEDAPEILVLYGQEYEADVFVIAGTGSGCPVRTAILGQMEREVMERVSAFTKETQFALFFDAHGQDFVKFPANGTPVEATEANKARAAAFLKAKPPQGSPVCLGELLLAGLKSALASSARRKALIYVGGGEGYCNASDEATYLTRVLQEVTGTNGGKVMINVLGIKVVEPSRKQFLRALVARNGGTYTPVE